MSALAATSASRTPATRSTKRQRRHDLSSTELWRPLHVPYTPVPNFSSRLFGVTVRGTGHLRSFDEARVADPSGDESSFAVSCRNGDSLVGAMCIEGQTISSHSESKSRSSGTARLL